MIQPSFKPTDAIKDSNAPYVKTNLVLRSRFKTKYRERHINDLCMIFKKKGQYSEMKEHEKLDRYYFSSNRNWPTWD